MAHLFARLDFDLAWKRYRKDLSDQAFSEHPFEATIIESDLQHWLDQLRGKESAFNPSRSEVIDVLKPNYHLRPGSRLTAADGVMYQALLLDAAPLIRNALLWSATNYRFASILKEDQTSLDWFVNEYKGWASFREASLEQLESGKHFVLFTDIAGYFENISIQRIISDMSAIGVNGDTVKFLSQCLNRWGEPRQRGIPQGYRPSYVLGELYLNTIDRRLHNEGYSFARYVDDIRVFCDTKEQAIDVLHFLTRLLRDKELNLQSAKSNIYAAEEARVEIDGVTAEIAHLETSIRSQLRDFIDIDFGYASPNNIAAVLAEFTPASVVKLSSLRLTFDKHFASDSPVKFNKSLFHYCLNRFAATKDDYAARACLSLLTEQPQELKSVLEYFQKLGSHLDLVNDIIAHFPENSAVDHQKYLLLRHIYKNGIASEAVIDFARQCSFNRNLDDYTRDYARAILGRHGDTSDLDALESQYNSEQREVSKAGLLLAIRRMDKSRRNAVYARAQQDQSFLIQSAINTARAG